MSAALALQQQALLQALWQPRHEDAIEFAAARMDLAARSADVQWQRGLMAYRSNGHALAQRSLVGAYPVLAQLLGDENFAALAVSLWSRHPPRSGDIAIWGDALAEHVESLDDLIDQEPFLGDVARVEWLLHGAATAIDATLDAASLQCLAAMSPSDFTLVLGPGTATVASAYPVVSLISAHLGGEPTLDEAARRLRGGVRETALVWREGFRPRLREAVPGEAAFIAALQEKRSLADSLQAAPELEFDGWLAPAVHSGLLVGAVELITEKTT